LGSYSIHKEDKQLNIPLCLLSLSSFHTNTCPCAPYPQTTSCTTREDNYHDMRQVKTINYVGGNQIPIICCVILPWQMPMTSRAATGPGPWHTVTAS